MSGRAPVPPEAVRAKAAAAYRSRRAGWIRGLGSPADPGTTDSGTAESGPAADSGPAGTLTIALHPPTENRVAADPDAAVAWVRSWQMRTGPGTLEWEERRWRSYGTQRVPVRLTLVGAAEVAEAAGTSREWRAVCARAARLERLASGAESPSGSSAGAGSSAGMDSDAGTARAALPDVRSAALPDALARSATRWLRLSETDFVLLEKALAWLRDNPGSGLYIRALPIPGVDTKWVTGHRGLLETLLAGLRGGETEAAVGQTSGAGDLGVRTLPRMCDVAVCDRGLLPGAPRKFAAPLDELAALDVHPRRVLMLENKEGLYALGDLPGTIALHGGGYAVHELASLPWLAGAQCWYWGDLDTHGFAILDRLRAHLPGVHSLLMDAETLREWESLAVDEPSPSTRTGLPRLTDGERAAFALVAERGLRLEQERVPWPYAQERLAALL